MRIRAAFILALAAVLILPFGAFSERGPLEEKRLRKLEEHLRKVSEPHLWLIMKKFFAKDTRRRLKVMKRFMVDEPNWPWYNNSSLFDSYSYSVDFIPINTDDDPEKETLAVVRTDPAANQYITFTLMDDRRKGYRVLSAYSDLSRGEEIRFEVRDLTGDGKAEVVVQSSDGAPGYASEAVRIIKFDGREFALIWSARTKELFEWPPQKIEEDGQEGLLFRKEEVKAEVKFPSPIGNDPIRILLVGDRILEERKKYPASEKETWLRESFPLHKVFRWDSKRFRFIEEK